MESPLDRTTALVVQPSLWKGMVSTLLHYEWEPQTFDSSSSSKISFLQMSLVSFSTFATLKVVSSVNTAWWHEISPVQFSKLLLMEITVKPRTRH